MKIKDKVKNYLYEIGIFGSALDEVMQYCIGHDLLKSMKGRWEDNIDGYPDVMYNVIVLSVRTCALEWSDKNMPLAFWRQSLM